VKRAKNHLQVIMADNSVMSHNEVIEGLSIELGGVQCIITVLWATDQPSHDMIIENNFQRLYSPCTQTVNQIICTINGYSVPTEKLRLPLIKKLSLHAANVVKRYCLHNEK